ncbi:MAG: hypothetical protein ACOC2B_06605 [Sediminispirochaetaceae bacterium]
MNDIEDLEEIEELEEIEDLSADEEAASLSADQLPSSDTGELLNTPLCSSLTATMQRQQFPSILISRNLEIIWENDAYRSCFADDERPLPVNLAKDFYPDLDSEKTGRIYRALGDEEKGFNHREQLQSIKRNRLTVIANAHFSPVFSPDYQHPSATRFFSTLLPKSRSFSCKIHFFRFWKLRSSRITIRADTSAESVPTPNV